MNRTASKMIRRGALATALLVGSVTASIGTNTATAAAETPVESAAVANTLTFKPDPSNSYVAIPSNTDPTINRSEVVFQPTADGSLLTMTSNSLTFKYEETLSQGTSVFYEVALTPFDLDVTDDGDGGAVVNGTAAGSYTTRLIDDLVPYVDESGDATWNVNGVIDAETGDMMLTMSPQGVPGGPWVTVPKVGLALTSVGGGAELISAG